MRAQDISQSKDEKPGSGGGRGGRPQIQSGPTARNRRQAGAGKALPKITDAAFAVISRRAADRLRSGHVWVYQSDIETIVAPTDGSGLIAVFDQRGTGLGTALYSAHSQIALRLAGRAKIENLAWPQVVKERLRAAISLRRPILAAEQTDACRLVFSEADFLPGLIADKYGDLVILQILTKGMDNAAVREAFLEVVTAEIDPRAIFERADARIRELEHLSPATDGTLYTKSDGWSETSASTVFSLNGLRFRFDANAGQKTGAFLDQRENYAAAARHCGGDALDVCTYQGGFALHLARGCRHVTGVDSSRPALETAEQNLELNRDLIGDGGIEWIEANAFDLLRDWSDSGRKFDSIVLDPPAFAKSKRAAEGALRGYKELNLRALKMLRPGGTLVTCSCSHHVGLEEFTAVVAAAGRDARREIRLVERRGAGGDHPVLLTVPETEYLKCLICRVD
jgi:23S rRNA (cytosine1962-C5)-methyltransferase